MGWLVARLLLKKKKNLFFWLLTFSIFGVGLIRKAVKDHGEVRHIWLRIPIVLFTNLGKLFELSVP